MLYNKWARNSDWSMHNFDNLIFDLLSQICFRSVIVFRSIVLAPEDRFLLEDGISQWQPFVFDVARHTNLPLEKYIKKYVDIVEKTWYV